MYRLKHVSKLGNDIAYYIEYKTFLGTSDITIYYDTTLNTWDGTIHHGNIYRDIVSDKAALIINELLIQTYMKGSN